MWLIALTAGLVLGAVTTQTIHVANSRRREAATADAPITWCGNCGQPTAALCHAHKQQASQQPPSTPPGRKARQP